MTVIKPGTPPEAYLPAHQIPQCVELKAFIAQVVSENRGQLSPRHQVDALVAAAADILRATRAADAQSDMVPSAHYVAGMFTRYWVEADAQDKQLSLFAG